MAAVPPDFGGSAAFFFSLFIHYWAEATKSCFLSIIAAFELGSFHRVCGGGSKIPAPKVSWLPLILVSFFGSAAEAAKFLLRRSPSCL